MRLKAAWQKITVLPVNVFFSAMSWASSSLSTLSSSIWNLKKGSKFISKYNGFHKSHIQHNCCAIFYIIQIKENRLNVKLRSSIKRDSRDSKGTLYHITSHCIDIGGKGQRVQFRLSCSKLNKLANYRVYDFFLIYAFQAPRWDQKNLLGN